MRHLVLIVTARGKKMHYVSKCPHIWQYKRVCVCVCMCVVMIKKKRVTVQGNTVAHRCVLIVFGQR